MTSIVGQADIIYDYMHFQRFLRDLCTFYKIFRNNSLGFLTLNSNNIK